MKDYKKIYGDCQDSLLFRTMTETVKGALEYDAKTRKAKGRFACDVDHWNVDGLNSVIKRGFHFDLLRDVQSLAQIISDDYAAQFGPRLDVNGPKKVSFDRAHILAFDFDEDRDLCRFSLPDYDAWHETGFAHAATAYRRECHWDFAPGAAGVWLCYYLITDGYGGNSEWYYNGNLVGFVILYDREKDGGRTLGHIWTASAARRHGVATVLIEYARKNFPLRTVEGPLTKDGNALINRVWPEVLDGSK
jgi:hypothetical protein